MGVGSFLITANIVVLLAALVIFWDRPMSMMLVFLCYGEGLRQAVAADHIALINNVTRAMMQQGKRPVSVGLIFALGYSTTMFTLPTVAQIAAPHWFNSITSFGTMAATPISASSLLLTAAINAVILIVVVRTFQRVRAGGSYHDEDIGILLARRGLLSMIFRRSFGLVEHSWQMFPIGMLFGLKSELVGNLSITGSATIESLGAVIVMVPLLFIAGMSLIETANGVLMLGAYGLSLIHI